jgi:hypothetical protein
MFFIFIFAGLCYGFVVAALLVFRLFDHASLSSTQKHLQLGCKHEGNLTANDKGVHVDFTTNLTFAILDGKLESNENLLT